MKVVIGVLFLLLALSRSIHAQGPSNDIEALMIQFGSALNTLFSDITILEGSAADIAQCGSSNLFAAIENGAQCIKDNNPTIPEEFFTELLGATNAKVSLCHLPESDEPGATTIFAFSVTGDDDDDVESTCPGGEMLAFEVPVLLRNVPATYTVYDPASIVTYSNSDALATVTDPDGPIISAVTPSTLPPGVGLNNATGTIYVSSKDNLLDGAYNITVTTTDNKGGKTTEIVTIVLLGAICYGMESCGVQCFNPLVHHCILSNGRRHLCVIGQELCNPSAECCYDPSVQVCINGALCPLGCGMCGSQCYTPSVWDCVDSYLIPKGFLRCGGTSYDPNDYVCADPSGILCPTGGYGLCGGGCYLPTVYTCQPNNSLCPYNKVLCGIACYNPNDYNCCAGSLCPKTP